MTDSVSDLDFHFVGSATKTVREGTDKGAILTDHNSSLRAVNKTWITNVRKAIGIEERQTREAIAVRVKLKSCGWRYITFARTQDHEWKRGSEEVSHVETHAAKN